MIRSVSSPGVRRRGEGRSSVEDAPTIVAIVGRLAEGPGRAAVPDSEGSTCLHPQITGFADVRSLGPPVHSIARTGLEGATLRAVADEGGWSVGVVQHYFRNKSELLAAAVDYLAERTAGALDDQSATSPVLERLTAVLYRTLPTSREPTENYWRVWICFGLRPRTIPPGHCGRAARSTLAAVWPRRSVPGRPTARFVPTSIRRRGSLPGRRRRARRDVSGRLRVPVSSGNGRPSGGEAGKPPAGSGPTESRMRLGGDGLIGTGWRNRRMAEKDPSRVGVIEIGITVADLDAAVPLPGCHWSRAPVRSPSRGIHDSPVRPRRCRREAVAGRRSAATGESSARIRRTSYRLAVFHAADRRRARPSGAAPLPV